MSGLERKFILFILLISPEDSDLLCLRYYYYVSETFDEHIQHKCQIQSWSVLQFPLMLHIPNFNTIYVRATIYVYIYNSHVCRSNGNTLQSIEL